MYMLLFITECWLAVGWGPGENNIIVENPDTFKQNLPMIVHVYMHITKL